MEPLDADQSLREMRIHQKSSKTFETHIFCCQFISALTQSYLLNMFYRHDDSD